MQHQHLILQCDQTGRPRKWIDYEKASHYYCKDLVAWDAGCNDTILHGGLCRATNTQSQLKLNTIIAVKGNVSKTDKKITLSNNVLFKRDGRICGYCGRSFNIKDLTRDHIHPKTHGGTNDWNNIITACKPCNCFKGDKSIKQMGMELLVKPYVPNYAEYLFLNNISMTEDQYDFLIKLIPEHSRVHKFYSRER
jgi:5-methylcytosine-specific restriction endonuclease McrA